MGLLKKIGIGIVVTFAIIIVLGIYGSTLNSQNQFSTTTTLPAGGGGGALPSTTTTTSSLPAQNIMISYTGTVENGIDYTLGNYPYTAQPDSGKIFLVVNMTIKNNGYDKFSVNPFYFHVIVNNIKYNYDSNTYYLADKLGSVDILNGGKLSGSLVFQIPSSDSSLPFNLTYDVPFVSYNIIWSKI
jgi:hypothetical protein